MTTLREELTKAGFDWSKGTIILQTVDGYSAGWSRPKEAFKIEAGSLLPESELHSTLMDASFDDGFGAPNMPRFIAEDDNCIYVVGTYDGSTWVESIYKDINKYLSISNPTPYIGG